MINHDQTARRRQTRPFAAGIRLATLILLAVGFTAPAAAQQTAGDQPAAITNSQAEAILGELREMRKLLEKIQKQGGAPAAKRRGPPATATVMVKDRPAIGATDAPVTVVEFSDFQCPFCKRFIDNTYPKLKARYIDQGKVRWVFRDLPLGFHKDARKAAQAAHCAGDQGKYAEMRDILFSNNRQLGKDRLTSYAKVAGLDIAAFDTCLGSDRHLDQVDRDSKDAARAGITGTPTFVVGKTAGDSVKGRTVVGAQALAVFESAIKQYLGQQAGNAVNKDKKD